MKRIKEIVLLIVLVVVGTLAQNDPEHGKFWSLQARTSFTSIGTSTFTGVATFAAAPVFTLYPTFSTVTAGIDSFTTTGATDSITVGAGYSATSKVFISHFNPAHSTEVDTAIYSGQVVTTGAGLIKLVVSRVKSYKAADASAVKSGAQYFYEVRK
jgi:hypothetical protein